MHHNYDADVRKVDGDELTSCRKCGTFMLPLSKYEISKSEAPGIDVEWQEFLLYGWAVLVFHMIYNAVDDLFTLKARKERLAQLKKDILATAPASSVCPKCLRDCRQSIG